MTPFVASPRSGPEPFLPPLADTEFLIALLAEVTNQDPGTVRYRYEREKRQLGSNVRDALVQWGLQPYVWDDRLSDFYSQTDAFLFETLVWNQHPVKVQMRQWMGEFFQRDVGCAARVLTFGDGLGVDSLYLAQLGHAVDYFEVSQPCARFAQALGARLNTTLNLIDSKEKLAPRAYDVVVCLDVLEHVPDPAKLVEELSGWLRPAGRLIVHAPFWHIHPSVGTHLASNRTYSGDLSRLYKPAGLRLIDGHFFWSPIVLEMTRGTRLRTPVPWGRRLALALGGALLSVARLWNWPHELVWMIARASRGSKTPVAPTSAASDTCRSTRNEFARHESRA